MINKKGLHPSQAFVFSELLRTRPGAGLVPQESVELPALQHPSHFAEPGEPGLRGLGPQDRAASEFLGGQGLACGSQR